MKNIEISEEVYAALQKLANGFNQTPDAVLASLLNVARASRNAADPLAAFVLSTEFRRKFTDAIDIWHSRLAGGAPRRGIQ